MKTIKKLGAQGDVLFLRIKKIPATAVARARSGGPLVVAHSETGHHHVIPDAAVAHFVDSKNMLRAYIQVDTSADVVHLRPFDTHETLRLGAGAWEIRRQREMRPEGWARVED